MTRSSTLILSLLATTACTDAARIATDRDAAARSIEGGSYEERIVLALVNTADQETLDDDVALDRRAAANIVAHRQGADDLDGTDDDDLFGDLAELDAVAYVGPSALDKLLDYALALYGEEEAAPAAVVHGISEGSATADAVLLLVHHLDQDGLDDDVALDSRAVTAILAARTEGHVATLTELDSLSYMGASAFAKLADFAAGNDLVVDDCTAGDVWIAGGATYDSPDVAVRAAADGDVVFACGGTWTEPVVFETGAALVGVGGAEANVLDVEGAGSVVTVQADGAQLRGFTLTGGVGAGEGEMTGGGVQHQANSGSFRLWESVVEGNRADSGGGLALYGDAVLYDVLVRDNDADGRYGFGGGIEVYDATLVAREVVVEGNRAERAGGVHIYFDHSSVRFWGGSISDNSAEDFGGGVMLDGQLELVGTRVEGNRAPVGAAIFQGDDDSTVSFDGATVAGNVAAEGSGAHALSGGVLVSIDTDWGADGTDNSPADLVILSDGAWSAHAATADFDCQLERGEGGCTY